MFQWWYHLACFSRRQLSIRAWPRFTYFITWLPSKTLALLIKCSLVSMLSGYGKVPGENWPFLSPNSLCDRVHDVWTSSVICNIFFFKSLLFTELYTPSAVFINNCAFQKHSNSEVHNPTGPVAFFAAVNILSGPLRKQNFTLKGSKGHGKVIP